MDRIKGQFIFIIIFTCFIFLTFSVNELEYQKQIDVQALLQFKMWVKIDPSLVLSNWVAETHVCIWTGISCDHKQRVVSVVLKYRELHGTITPHIGNIFFLTTLDLSNNHFSGIIPHQLGNLNKLQYLKLYGNSLEGSIPVTLSSCRNLRQLRLNDNLLNGTIPSELSSLKSLEKLILDLNRLEGIIPEELGNCSALKSLSLADNLLTGPVPYKLSVLSDLRILILEANGLSGGIPKSLGSCTKLRVLSLSYNVLEGSFPSEILTTMTRLEILSLGNNKLNGSIGQEIGKLGRLKELYLHDNALTGVIPTALGNCSSLEMLALLNNSLSGNVPSELGSLMRLQVLYLQYNSLTGLIPSSLMNCTELTRFGLLRNQLVGPIPEDIGYKLSKLQRIDLSQNQLNGSIPKSLANCSALDYIAAQDNQLGGVIPGELGMLTRLQDLGLDVNYFTGNILTTLLNCTELQKLSFAENMFDGPIPTEIGVKLTKLQQFSIGGNQFTGRIPNSLGNCSQLSLLDLSDNRLTGEVPQEFGMLTRLRKLVVDYNGLTSGSSGTLSVLDVLSNCSILEEATLHQNNFSGTLPTSIGNLSQRLSILSLEGNYINGSIPEELGNLSGLTQLHLYGNNIVGKVPGSLGFLRNLQELDLSFNKLQGTIPPEFSKLVNLENLFLQQNHFSGEIPSFIGNLKQLRRLDLSQNEVQGRIPNTIGECFRLEKIDLSYNSLTGSVPMGISSLHSLAFYLNLSHNALTGRLPSLGGMQMIQAIDMSDNKFSRTIPGDIVSCVGLQLLNLSNNQLEGNVPNSIGHLKSLETVDFSFNKLSGPVPKSIANLTMLSHLNFSYNSLNGSIPNEGAFRNLSTTSFLRNPGLCAESGWLNLPNCTGSLGIHIHSNGFNRKIVLLVSIGTFMALCCILGGFYILYKNIKRSPFKNNLLRQSFMQISSQELFRATDGFSTSNLLGTGSFGSVYKGLLADNTLVAVKVFDQDPQNSFKNFYRECNILRRIRHRNLVKVLSSSSTEDFKALILEFMSKGSLDQQLHKDDEMQCNLSLKMRVKIALDVAHGMAYLHHDCSPPVVHCDLKPCNVLMDESMTAHVSDFGIARLMASSSDNAASNTSRLKGTVGYLAPEYGLGGQVSIKGDVYSFGVLIFEMMSRKRPTDEMFRGDNTLSRWVRTSFPEAVKEVVDKELLIDELSEAGSSNTGDMSGEFESSIYENCLVGMFAVGLKCSTLNPSDRPTMRDVEGMLEKILHGKGYGNLKEATTLPTLLIAGNRKSHPNTGSTSSSDYSK